MPLRNLSAHHGRHSAGVEECCGREAGMIRELENHDLRERLHWFELDRRDFLRLCGGGLLVCLASGSILGQRGGREHELPNEISAWIYIDAKGNVTVFTGK